MPQQHTSTDQVKFLGQWFGAWSEMQREDFLPILVQAYHPKDHINGLVGGIDSLKLQGRRPSLFDCQVKLFHDWIVSWTENERSELLEEMRNIDPDFMAMYDKEVKGETSRDSTPPTECPEEGQNPPSSVSSPPSTLPRSHSPHDSGLDEPPSDGDHTEPHSLDSHQENDDPTTVLQAADSSNTSVATQNGRLTPPPPQPIEPIKVDNSTTKELPVSEDVPSPREANLDVGEQ